jgi:hypothetical protein
MLPALTVVLLAPSVAQSHHQEGHPEFYTNGIVDTSNRVEQVNYGQLLLKSSVLPGAEIECVWLAFGTSWNEGPPGLQRALSQILTWSANGHLTEGTHTEIGAKCRGG